MKWIGTGLVSAGILAVFSLVLRGAAASSGYSTHFAVTENPIADSGKWINGPVGLDWAAVRVNAGLAFGTESGKINYDDSTALLAGTWAADQTVQATVHTKNQHRDTVYEEVELRLRSSISKHRCTGYEVNFRCTGHNSGYNQIVRWNGALGDFKILSDAAGGAADGDVIRATIVGNVITVYRNGVQVNQTRDGAYSSGNPGIGFYLQGGPPSLNSDYGFTAFSAE